MRIPDLLARSVSAARKGRPRTHLDSIAAARVDVPFTIALDPIRRSGVRKGKHSSIVQRRSSSSQVDPRRRSHDVVDVSVNPISASCESEKREKPHIVPALAPSTRIPLLPSSAIGSAGAEKTAVSVM